MVTSERGAVCVWQLWVVSDWSLFILGHWCVCACISELLPPDYSGVTSNTRCMSILNRQGVLRSGKIVGGYVVSESDSDVAVSHPSEQQVQPVVAVENLQDTGSSPRKMSELLKSVKVFDGKSNVTLFVTMYERACVAANLDAAEHLLFYVSETVYAVVSLAVELKKGSWAAVKAKLLEMYGPKLDQPELLRKFRQSVQGPAESVLQFYESLAKKTMHMDPKPEDGVLVKVFVTGLRVELRRLVELCPDKCETVSAAFAFALEMERDLAKEERSSNVAKMVSSSGTTLADVQFQRKEVRQSGKKSEAAQSDVGLGPCWHCKGDHVIAECKRKQKGLPPTEGSQRWKRIQKQKERRATARVAEAVSENGSDSDSA